MKNSIPEYYSSILEVMWTAFLACWWSVFIHGQGDEKLSSTMPHDGSGSCFRYSDADESITQKPVPRAGKSQVKNGGQ